NGIVVSPMRNGMEDQGEYAKYRCRRRRTCIADLKYDTPTCKLNEFCPPILRYELTGSTFECPKNSGYKLWHTVLGKTSELWYLAESLSCNPPRFVTAGRTSQAIPHRFQCVKEKKCELKVFIH
ncbi:hypothetical protein PENTCL1PPCAC_1409, partial [Pristionchus entomophagus]